MSNRAHRRRRHHRTKLRNIAWIDRDQVTERLAACDCPATVHTVAGAVVVEHWHRHGCPALEERTA